MKEKWSLHNENKNIIGKNQKQMTNLKKLLKINIKKSKRKHKIIHIKRKRHKGI